MKIQVNRFVDHLDGKTCVLQDRRHKDHVYSRLLHNCISIIVVLSLSIEYWIDYWEEHLLFCEHLYHKLVVDVVPRQFVHCVEPAKQDYALIHDEIFSKLEFKYNC